MDIKIISLMLFVVTLGAFAGLGFATAHDDYYHDVFGVFHGINGEIRGEFSFNDSNTDANSENRIRILNNGNKNMILFDDLDFNISTDLDVDLDGENLFVRLGDGTRVTLSITPAEAIEIAKSETQTECEAGSESDECEIEIDTQIYNGETRVVYDVETEKRAVLLGLFEVDMEMETEVDAETGAVLDVDRPWWYFMVTSESEASLRR